MSSFLRFVWLTIAFFAPHSALYKAYVDYSGDDNAFCSSANPCATFQIVLQNIQSGSISGNEIVIKISGTNPVYPHHCAQSWNRFFIDGNITIIFDSATITSTTDWWPGIDRCIEQFTFDYFQCAAPFAPYP